MKKIKFYLLVFFVFILMIVMAHDCYAKGNSGRSIARSNHAKSQPRHSNGQFKKSTHAGKKGEGKTKEENKEENSEKRIDTHEAPSSNGLGTAIVGSAIGSAVGSMVGNAIVNGVRHEEIDIDEEIKEDH